jgi:pyruvate,water dikinase
MLRLRNDEIAHLLNDFLEEFGDRCPGELKLETRSYREYPELFLPFLLDESSSPHVIGKKKAGSGRGPLRWLDRKFASLISFRQGARWMRAGAFGVLRSRLLRMGALLEEKGAIESKEDIFYFQLGELLAMDSPSGNHRDLIMDRRVIHYDQGELRVRGRLKPGQNGEWLADPAPPVDPVRTNDPGNGPVEGEVLLIPSEDRLPSSPDLLRGKILVLHAAGPGIVHHLRWVGGLICETGSALSHASILCREFGVPSAFGAKGATEQLRNGQRIRWVPGTGVIESIDSPT